MSLTVPPPPLRLHARPALVLAAVLALGIVLERAWGLGLSGWAFVLAAAAALPPVVAIATRRRMVTPRPLARAVGAGLAALALGGARMAAWDTLPPDHVAHLAAAAEAVEESGGASEVFLWGRVVEPPVPVTAGLRLRLAADSTSRGGPARPLRGLVEVTLTHDRYAGGPPPLYPALDAGDYVRLEGIVRPLPHPRNPADFDYGEFLRRRGVGATLRLYDAEAVHFLRPASAGLQAAVSGVRAHVRRAVARYVRGEDRRAVLLALLVADRSGIDPDTRAAFVQTGLAHLLAVSGLHVLLVGLVLYTLLRPSLVRLGLGWNATEAVRGAITMGVLVLYALVTGGSPSVVRAVVMAGAMVAGRMLQRPSDSLNALGLAGLVLLLWRPAALYDVGFQLSFSAVAALVLLTPVLTAPIPGRWMAKALVRWTAGMLAASLAATLGTGPVLLYHFGQLPLAGLVLNLGAIPATQLALGAGLAVVLTGGWAPWMADAFAAVAELGAGAMLWISRAGADHAEWSLLEGYVTAPAAIGAMALAMLALAAWRAPRQRWATSAAALGCAAAGAWGGVLAGDARPRLDAVFLDVGQGDAALLSLPGGRHLLVDAGPRDETWDTGERTVVPHLRRFNVRRLDAVVVTHPHADHLGGLEAVLRNVRVGRVLLNGQPTEHPLLARALRVADSLGVPVRAVRAGDTLDLGPDARARVLAPASAPPAGASANDGSVVLRLEYGATSLLLTGDAEAAAEAALVARYGPALAADVVKVGHHGSRTSSTPAFVLAAGRGTTWAVVPVAQRNRYGLPDEEPLGRWAATGARVVLTGREGAVWLRSDGRRFERVEWRRGR